MTFSLKHWVNCYQAHPGSIWRYIRFNGVRIRLTDNRTWITTNGSSFAEICYKTCAKLSSFLLALWEENGFDLSRVYFAAVIGKKMDGCEQLIADDQKRGSASEEGLQAFLQCKLLIRLLNELPGIMHELIEGFQRGDYHQALDDYFDSVINLVNFDWAGLEENDDKKIENMNPVINIANRTINLSPEEGIAYLWRGGAYFRRGNYDKAIEDCTQAINYGIEDAIVYSLRGTARFLKNAYGGDLSSLNLGFIMGDFDEAICLMPNHATLYLTRGDIYRQIGACDKAIEDYDNAVRLCPNYETDCIDSRFMHGGKDQIEEAIKLLKSMVSDPPESAKEFYYTGVRSLFENDRLSAKLAFQIASEEDYGDCTKIDQHLANL